MQFAYTADRAGAYVAPAFTVLAQSAVAEGGDLFLVLLAYLRRLYPEVYSPVVAMGRAPECRNFQIGEGEGLSGGTSIHSIIQLGAYAGRLNNFNLEGMNNHIPNLNTFYLDTLLVGPTPEPLEYIPSSGCLG